MASNKLDLRKLPIPVRRSFGWMLEPIKMLHGDPWALVRCPTTAASRVAETMGKSYERRIAKGGAEGMVRDICALFNSLPAAELAKADARRVAAVQKERRRVARYREGAHLLALMDAAHRRVRNSPLLVVPHPTEHGTAKLVVYQRLDAVHATRGEERARLLLDAYVDVFEGLYRPYLHAVWKLVHFVDGIVPTPAPRQPGRLVQQLATRISRYLLLVEHDAVHVRNAIVHRRATYMAGQHAMKMHDVSGWERVVNVKEIETLTYRIFGVAGDLYPSGVNTFMQEGFVRPLMQVFPEFARVVVANDREAIKVMAADINRRKNDVWADVASLYSARPTAE